MPTCQIEGFDGLLRDVQWVHDFLVEDDTGTASVWIDERHAHDDDACVMYEIEGQIDWVEPGDAVGTRRERIVMEGDRVAHIEVTVETTPQAGMLQHVR